MQRAVLPIIVTAFLVPLAGCLGGDDNPWQDFEPGQGFEPTGRTVHLRMWVEDMLQSDIYPGFQANLWAFCAEAANPNDQYSADAIEWREPTGSVARLQPDNSYRLDEDATSKCSVPGPQLRVQQGDRVIVDFANDHFHPHTIHWHGQFVPWESDGVPGSTQDSVVPGTTFRYEFVAKRAGTMWYHCHVDTQFHVMQGLFGMIIVEPQDKTFEPETDKEYSLVFSNLIRDQVEYIPPAPGEVFDPHAQHKHGGKCGPSGFPDCQNPAIDATPDVFMINGVSAPNTFQREDTLMTINPDESIRIRMLNAGPFTVETIHLHGHDMLVTHKDGNPLHPDARMWVDTLIIGPGERYDVVVQGREDAKGIWVMHTHITSRVTNDGQYPGGMLTKLVYEEILEEFGSQPFIGVELPGGTPARFPVTIPEDMRQDDVLGLSVLGADTATTQFEITQACAVQGVHILGTAASGTPGVDLLNALDVTLSDPSGAVLFTANVGGLTAADGDDFNWQVVETAVLEEFGAKDLLNGNYTIAVTGQQVEADLHTSILVDYYPNLETADLAAAKYGKDLCGLIDEYTNLF